MERIFCYKSREFSVSYTHQIWIYLTRTKKKKQLLVLRTDSEIESIQKTNKQASNQRKRIELGGSAWGMVGVKYCLKVIILWFWDDSGSK